MNNQRKISAHKKIKHLTKKYRRFRYLKDKRKKIDLDQLFKCRLNRKETKELNFNNFFSKLNEFNKQKEEDLISSPDERIQIVENENRQISHENDEIFLAEELIKASSTITNRKIQRNQPEARPIGTVANTSSKKEAKKSSAAKHRAKTISLLNEFNRYEGSDPKRWKDDRIVSDEILINYFLNRIKDCLSKEEQSTLLGHLEEFDLLQRKLNDLIQRRLNDRTKQEISKDEYETNEKLKKIYLKISNLTSENNELIDEFLLFFNYNLAEKLNREFDFNYWIKVKNFVRKVVIYLNHDYGSLKRLLKLLKQLKQNESDLDKKRVRTVVSKFLNSQPYLLNELNTLFLEEAPQDYLFNFSEDFDEIDLDEEMNHESINGQGDSKAEKDGFEMINLNELLEEEQNYSTKDCPCKFCHHTPADKFSASNETVNPNDSHSKHCISCSLVYKNKMYYCGENQKLNFTSIEYVEDG